LISAFTAFALPVLFYGAGERLVINIQKMFVGFGGKKYKKNHPNSCLP
jgi:hypothetical protein